MVNKEVCRKCVIASKGSAIYFDAIWDSKGIWRGAFCMNGNGGKAVEGKPPPTQCPHKLEHAMASAVNVDKKSKI